MKLLPTKPVDDEEDNETGNPAFWRLVKEELEAMHGPDRQYWDAKNELHEEAVRRAKTKSARKQEKGGHSAHTNQQKTQKAAQRDGTPAHAVSRSRRAANSSGPGDGRPYAVTHAAKTRKTDTRKTGAATRGREFTFAERSKGGKRGGKARAAALTRKERSEAARKAVLARWAKTRKRA